MRQIFSSLRKLYNLSSWTELASISSVILLAGGGATYVANTKGGNEVAKISLASPQGETSNFDPSSSTFDSPNTNRQQSSGFDSRQIDVLNPNNFSRSSNSAPSFSSNNRTENQDFSGFASGRSPNFDSRSGGSQSSSSGYSRTRNSRYISSLPQPTDKNEKAPIQPSSPSNSDDQNAGAVFGGTPQAQLPTSGSGETKITSDQGKVIATQLQFSKEPDSTIIAGQTIVVEIQIQNKYGTPVLTGSAASAPVTLSLLSGNGTLLGTLTKNATAGVVRFDTAEALVIQAVGAKTLKASLGGQVVTQAISADSASFTIVHSTASQMVVTTQPGSGLIIGDPIQFVAEIRDAFGNVVTSGADSTAPVTLSLQSGTGSLSGTLTKNAVAGVVSFSLGDNISISQHGSKILRATKSDLTGSGGVGVLTVDSASFSLDQGLANSLAFDVQPQKTLKADQSIVATVKILDRKGNTVTTGADSTANITLSLSSGTGNFSGTLIKKAVNGVAQFTATEALHIDLAGAKVLRATKEDLSSSSGSAALTVDSDTFDITHAAASKLSYLLQPVTTASGLPLLITIEILDQFGNLVTTGADATASVTLELDPAAGVLSGTKSKAAAAGVATFAAGDSISIDLVGTKVLKAVKANTVASGGTADLSLNSNSFDITHAGASRLVFATQPAPSVIAGADILSKIEIQDAQGNVITTGPDADANLTLTLNSGVGNLSGTLTLKATAGKVDFTASEHVYLDKVGTKSLKVQKQDTSGNGGTAAISATSNNFVVTHANASKIVYTTAPPSQVIAGGLLTPALEIQDTFGNIVTTGADSTANVTLTLQSGAGVLNGTLSKSAVNGVVSFVAADAISLDVVGSKTLRATKAQTASTADMYADASFSVIHSAAVKLVFSTQPLDNTVAGQPLNPVIEIRDVYNNVVTSGADATADVTLSLDSGSGPLKGALTKAAVNGVVTFSAGDNLNIESVGTKTLLATKADTSASSGSGILTQTSSSFTIIPAPGAQLVFVSQPASSVAGTNLMPSLEVHDAYGNVVNIGPDATADITLSLQSGSGQLRGTVTKAAFAGVVSFTASEGVNIDLVGQKTLRATKADTSASNGGTIGLYSDSNLFAITHAPANQITVTQQPPAAVMTGGDIPVSFAIQDQFGNTVTTGADSTAALSLALQSGAGNLSGTLSKNATNGVVSFVASDHVAIDTVGTKVLSATKADTTSSSGTGSISVNTNSFVVSPSAATSLAFSVQPANNTVAGTDLLPTIQILDGFGNVVSSGPDSTARITLSLVNPSTGTLSGTLTKAAVGGVITFTASEQVAINLVGSKVLRATKEDLTSGGGAPTFTVDSASFTIVHANASQLVYTTQPATSIIAGTAITPVVEIRDQFGNVVTTGHDATASMTLSLQTGSGVLSGTLTKNATAGVVSFTATENARIDLVGAKTLRITKAATATTGQLFTDSNSLTIVHAASSKLVYTTQPVDTVAGMALTPMIEIRDQFDNVVTSGSDATASITLSINSGTGPLKGTVTKAAVAGKVTFAAGDNVRIEPVGTKTLLATLNSLTQVSASFAILPAPAAQLAFVSQPINSVAGTNLLPSIEVRDAFGNVVATGPDATANITLSLQSGTGVLGGTLTKAAQAGVVSFTATEGVNINLVGAKVLRATKADTSGTTGGTVGVSTDSVSFAITHAAASNIIVAQQPPTTIGAGADILTSFTIQDQFGNTVTTGADATASVSLAIQSGTGTVSGTVNKNATAGVVTFAAADHVAIDTVGTKVLSATKADKTASGGTAAVSVNTNSFVVSPSAATSLAFSVQPANNTVAGTDLLPTIKILDAFGNIVDAGPDSTAKVTLSLVNPSTGILSGTLVKPAVAGVVTFSAADHVAINLVGAKVLRASKEDLSGSGGTAVLTIDSASFTIVHASASQLAYTTQPASQVVAGTTITSVIEIRDQFGNVVTTGNDATASMTLSLQSGTGTLLGTLTKNATAGIVSFTATENARIELAGAKTLRTTKATTASTGQLFADSSSFSIVHAAANKLVYTTQPIDTPAGQPLIPVVEIRDIFDNVVTTGADAIANITFTLDSGTGPLKGTVMKAAIAGKVTFLSADNFNIEAVGTKTLLATKADTSASSGTSTLTKVSSSFVISPAPAAQLVFTSQPASSVAGTNILPALEIRDAFGNVVNIGPDATASITLSLASGTGQLRGTVTKSAVAGVVSFSATEAVNIDLVGIKVLRATKADTLASSGGTASYYTDSGTFTITHDKATNVIVAQQPSSSSTSADLLLRFIIKDQFGNTVTTGPDSITAVSLALQSGTGNLTGTLSKNAINGDVSFIAADHVAIDTVGQKVIRATKADTTSSSGTVAVSVNTNTINITPSGAASLAFSVQPANNTVAGADLLPTIRILDGFGNIVDTGPDSTANVTLSLVNPSTGTLSGTLTKAAVAGVVTFASADHVAINLMGSKVLRASKEDLSGGGGAGVLTVDSSSFTIIHANASQLVYTTQPPNQVVAGNAINPVIEIRDQFGNVVTTGADSSANMTLSLQSGTGTLSGTLTKAAVAGVVTFTATENARLDLVGSKTLRITKPVTAVTGQLVADSTAFTIIPAPASKLVYSTQPVNTVAGVALVPVIEVRDQFDNLVTSGADSTATITLSLNSGSGPLGGTVAKAAVSGKATFAAGDNVNIQTVGTKTFLATKADTTSSSGTGSVTQVSNSFVISPAPAAQLVFTSQPTNSIAGKNLLPVLEIRDAFGNVVNTGPDASANVTLTLQSGTGQLRGTVNKAAVAGIVSFTATEAVNIDLVGSKILRATKADTLASSGTASYYTDSSSFVITHDSASKMTVAQQPSSISAGADILAKFIIQDQFGNTVTTGVDSTASVNLTMPTGTGTLAGTLTKAAVAGEVTFAAADHVNIDSIGSKVLRATKADTTSSSGTASVFVNTTAFTVTPATATSLAFSVQPANNTVAGADLLPVIRIVDAFGNVIDTGADSTAQVTLSLVSPSTGTLSGTLTKAAVAGVVTFTATEHVAINLIGAKILRATKEDLSAGGGTGTLTGDSASFTIVHSSASQLVYTTQPPAQVVAGNTLTPVVEIRDQYGNLVTTGADATASMTLSLESGNGTLSGTLTKAAVAGVVTFTATENARIDLIGTKTLRMTKAATGATGSIFAISNSFSIIHAVANKLVYTTQPTNNTAAGTLISAAIELQDTYGNRVTTGTDSTATISLSLQGSTGILSGTTSKALVAGVVSFGATENLSIDLTGAKVIRATKPDLTSSSGTGLIFVDSSSFNIINGTATQLVFVTQPGTAIAGQTLTPVLEIRDSFGNTVTTGPDATASVTLSLVSPSTGTLSGTLSKAAVGGVISFTVTQAVYIDLIGSKVLRATKADTTSSSGTGSISQDSNAFTITHGSAASLAFTSQPAQAVVGSPISFALKLIDTYGNTVTTGADSSANITMSIASGGGALGGTATKALSSGVVSWAGADNLNISTTGSKVLRATKANLSGSGGTGSLLVDSSSFSIVSGPATTLVYTTQPAASVVAGNNITMTIELRDSLGNVVSSGTDATANVTLSLFSGTGTISGTVTKPAVNGVVQFLAADTVKIDLVGVKTIRATKEDLSGSGGGGPIFVDSNSVTITHAAASQLAFTTVPSTPRAAVFDTIVVTVQDQFGNTVTTGANATATMTLTLPSKPANLTNAACGTTGTSNQIANFVTAITPSVTTATSLVTTASSGVASFSGNVAFNNAGSYTVQAATSGTSVTVLTKTNALSVTHGPVAALFWRNASGTSTPADTTRTAGQNFSTGTVVACDATNNTATTATDLIDFSVQDDDVVPNPTGDFLHASSTSTALASGVANLSSISASLWLASGNYYLIATNLSTGAITATGSGAITISAAAYTTLRFTSIPTTWPNNTGIIPSVTAQVSDAYGNLRTGSCTSGTATISLSTNPNSSTLVNATSATSNNCIFTWSVTGSGTTGVGVVLPGGGSAVSTSGFVARATTSASLCNGNTTTCTGDSAPFSVTTDPGLNLVHAFDMLDVPAGCLGKNNTTLQTIPFSQTPFNPNWFSGNPVTYALEVVITNPTTTGTFKLALLNSAGTADLTTANNAIGSSITNRRYSFAFTPSTGITSYKLRMSNCSTNTANAWKVNSARIVVTQSSTNSYASAVHIPLISAGSNDVQAVNVATSPVDSTTSTTSTQGNANDYSIWEYDSSLFDQIPATAGLKFYAILSNSSTGTAYAELWEKSGASPIATLSVVNSTAATYTETDLNKSVLTNLGDYEVRIRSSNTTSSARIHKAGLVVKIESMKKYATYWRVSPFVTSTTTTLFDTHRTNFDRSKFSSNTVAFECTGTSNGATIDLVNLGNTDVGGTASVVNSSPMTFTGTKGLSRITGLELLANMPATGARSYAVQTNAGNAINVNNCRIVVNH